MPMRVRVEMIERAAAAHHLYLPYRVTVYFPRSRLVKALYYVCGRCTLKEPDNPSGRAEQRDHRVPPDADCHYCGRRAQPWTG
jgi:hypothetical protein